MQPEQRLHAGSNSKVSEIFLTSYRNKEREKREGGKEGKEEGRVTERKKDS